MLFESEGIPLRIKGGNTQTTKGSDNMCIEERADGLHISGYVNVTGKLSRPVVTPRGRVLETIEERAFGDVIAKSGDITVTLDHEQGHAYASTREGTLALK